MRAFVVCLVVLSACGPLTPLRPDAGTAGGTSGVGGGFVFAGGGVTGGGSTAGGSTAGGSATAGGSTAGGATSGGSAAGGSTAGGSSVAGGASAGGAAGGSGLGDFTWASVSVIPAPQASSAQAVAARPNEAYLAIGSAVYRSTGGAFNEIASLTVAGNIKDLHVTPMGKVFVIGASASSRICTMPDCSVAGNYTLQTSGQTYDFFDGLCGSGESVFAIGNGNNNQAILFEFNGTGWTKVSTDLGFINPKRCVVAPTGEVYVLGASFVIRYEGGGFTQENVALMGQSTAVWNDMAFSFASSTPVGMLVGRTESTLPQQSYRFARRNPSGGGWTTLPIPMTGTTLSSITAVGPDEFIAAGVGTPRFMAFNGSTWAASTNQPPASLSQVVDAASASDREVFLVGSGTAGGYVVIRGRR